MDQVSEGSPVDSSTWSIELEYTCKHGGSSVDAAEKSLQSWLHALDRFGAVSLPELHSRVQL
jgi:hypothetical protein